MDPSQYITCQASSRAVSLQLYQVVVSRSPGQSFLVAVAAHNVAVHS